MLLSLPAASPVSRPLERAAPLDSPSLRTAQDGQGQVVFVDELVGLLNCKPVITDELVTVGIVHRVPLLWERPDVALHPAHQIRHILLSVSDEQKARLENTQAWTAPRTGVKSQQAFIRWGIEELRSRLEQEYNDGKPFDPIPGRSSE